MRMIVDTNVVVSGVFFGGAVPLPFGNRPDASQKGTAFPRISLAQVSLQQSQIPDAYDSLSPVAHPELLVDLK